ncbi:MAG: DUF1570 domain-containing protein [Planctomycetota bacterium]|nr:DUF1570 domain-containing protein [Planctomycetota bacterium]
MRTLALLVAGMTAWTGLRAAESSAQARALLAPKVIEAALDAGSPWRAPEKEAVERLVAELKRDLAGGGFLISPIGPWVVATDLEAEDAQLFLDSTIQVYAAGLQRQLFKTFRAKPVKVYLFKDAESYTDWNLRLFKERPGTPYGYYSRKHNAMVMNIGTGGGTLLHEMVHAMAEADWPDLPAWLNEGLGSLYEASQKVPSGRIMGVTNWRLRGLLRDLEDGKQTKLAELLKMDAASFYGARSGANYATARYLMQYLQQQAQLEAFYARLRDGQDPDAAASLRAVFENKFTLDELEAKLFAWVKTLRL